MNKSVLFLIILSIILSGCSSTALYTRSEKNHNNIEIYSGLKIKKDLNWAGHTSSLITAGAAGYGGYKVDFIESSVDKKQPALSGAIGAIAGYGLFHYISSGAGAGKIEGIGTSRYAEWKGLFEKEQNADYVAVNISDPIKIIRRNLIDLENFKIKNYTDACDYRALFDKNPFVKNILKRDGWEIERSDIERILSSVIVYGEFSDDIRFVLKDLYVKKSTSLYELSQSLSSYPELLSEVQKDSVYSNLFNRFVNNLADAEKFQSITKKSILVLPRKFVNSMNDNAKIACFEILLKEYAPKDHIALLKTLEQLNWIDFSSKETLYLDKLWDMNYDRFADGNELINYLGFAANLKWMNVSKETVDRFTSIKVENEKNRISLSPLDLILSSNSGEWERYKKRSAFGSDAFFVQESGTVKCIAKGYVTNNSKFDLPISVGVNLSVLKKTNAILINDKVTEGLKFLGKLCGAPAEQVDDKIENLGVLCNTFYIPMLKRGEKTAFALLYDSQLKESGGKFLVVKSTTETWFQQYSTSIDCKPVYLTADKSEDQKKWLQIAEVGFEKNELQKAISIFSLDMVKYDEAKFEKMREQERDEWIAAWDKTQKDSEKISELKRDGESLYNITDNGKSDESPDIWTYTSKVDESKTVNINRLANGNFQVEKTGFTMNDEYKSFSAAQKRALEVIGVK